MIKKNWTRVKNSIRNLEIFLGHEYKKILDTTKKTSLDVKIIYQIFAKPLHHEFLPTPLAYI